MGKIESPPGRPTKISFPCTTTLAENAVATVAAEKGRALVCPAAVGGVQTKSAT